MSARVAISRGFTLIEVLIAVLLVGVGVASVLGLVLQATRLARQASFWAMSTPAALSAAEYAVTRGLITPSSPADAVVDLPAPDQSFESPLQFRIDLQPAPGAAAPPSAHSAGALRVLRIRCYDSIDDRAADIRTRGTFHVVRLLRTSP
jgi:prepilin-type N-terminal cleavage/methylation domain-containing protein